MAYETRLQGMAKDGSATTLICQIFTIACDLGVRGQQSLCTIHICKTGNSFKQVRKLLKINEKVKSTDVQKRQ